MKAFLLIFLFGVAAQAQSLFQSTEPLHFTITAPVKKIIEEREERGLRYEGKLEYEKNGQKTSLPISLKVRGESTRMMCAFPKLRILIENEKTTNTDFAGAESVRVNTHCHDGTMGTIPVAAKTTPREAFIYRLLNALGVQTYQSRPAIITYVDSEDKNFGFTRSAFFLEEKKLAGTRLAGKLEPLRYGEYEPLDVAKVVFAEVMVANSDWNIDIIKGGIHVWKLHNVENYLRPDNSGFLLPNDFNLSGPVIGFPNFLSGSDAKLVEWIKTTLETAKNNFGASVFEAAMTHFRERETVAWKLLDEADFSYISPKTNRLEADADAKALFKFHLAAFFKVISERQQ